jgi:hypothetical protein
VGLAGAKEGVAGRGQMPGHAPAGRGERELPPTGGISVGERGDELRRLPARVRLRGFVGGITERLHYSGGWSGRVLALGQDAQGPAERGGLLQAGLTGQPAEFPRGQRGEQAGEPPRRGEYRVGDRRDGLELHGGRAGHGVGEIPRRDHLAERHHAQPLAQPIQHRGRGRPARLAEPGEATQPRR